MKAQDVCTVGNAEACKRVKFTEAGSFAGGIGDGALAGVLTVSLVGGLRCINYIYIQFRGFGVRYCSSWRRFLCGRRILLKINLSP